LDEYATKVKEVFPPNTDESKLGTKIEKVGKSPTVGQSLSSTH
jgi:hypothetical protein